MATSSTHAHAGASKPIVWALAIVIVLVGSAYTYSIVTRCQPSTFEAVKSLRITFGKCEAPSIPERDRPAPPATAASPQPAKVSRAEMPCRWAWIYLGKYSPSHGAYVLPPAFRFADGRGPASPFPGAGDRIVLTADKTLLVRGYAEAAAGTKCDRILDPPWEYRPETAKAFEAGMLKRGSELAVNQVTFMPGPSADPTYVWALVGPEL